MAGPKANASLSNAAHSGIPGAIGCVKSMNLADARTSRQQHTRNTPAMARRALTAAMPARSLSRREKGPGGGSMSGISSIRSRRRGRVSPVQSARARPVHGLRSSCTHVAPPYSLAARLHRQHHHERPVRRIPGAVESNGLPAAPHLCRADQFRPEPALAQHERVCRRVRLHQAGEGREAGRHTSRGPLPGRRSGRHCRRRGCRRRHAKSRLAAARPTHRLGRLPRLGAREQLLAALRRPGAHGRQPGRWATRHLLLDG
eukprot:scaffold78734_cov69-Phaeocystis_antarctica.AAC.4